MQPPAEEVAVVSDEEKQRRNKKRRILLVIGILLVCLFCKFYSPKEEEKQKDVVNFSCVSAEDVGSGARAPFLYKDLQQHRRVQATLDPAGSGMCLFPGSHCHASAQCCKTAPWAKEEYNSAFTIASYGPTAVIFVTGMLKALLLFLRRRSGQRDEQAQELREEMLQQRQDTSEEQYQGAMATLNRELTEFQKWVKKGSKLRIFLLVGVMIIILLALFGEAYVQQFKHSMTQRLLSLPDRNAMALSDHFLTPVQEVFQFLEDSVLIKLTFAMSVGNFTAGRAVLNIGIWGGLVLGTFGACLVTALCCWPAALHFLVDPSARLTPAGCAFAGDNTVLAAQVYLILNAWRWPFMFANLAMSGYLQGTGSIKSLLIYIGAYALENGLQLIAFLIIFPLEPSLRIVALFHCIPSLFSFLLYGVLIRHLHAQDEYKEAERNELDESDKSISRSVSGNLEKASSLWGNTAQEGLCAMVVDLIVHTNVTVGMYVAGFQLGPGALYQLSFVQSVFMQFGSQVISQMKYTIKFQIAPLLAQKKMNEFYTELMYLSASTVAIIILSCVALLPYRQGVVFTLASSACRYADNSVCLPVYDAVFGGAQGLAEEGPQTTIQQSFLMSIPIIGTRIFFAVVRAGLYCCFDFSFMAKTACAIFTLICLPALVAVTQEYLPFTSVSILAVMYLPYFLLSIAFAFRLLYIIWKMIRGEGGPWLKAKI